MKLYTVVSIKPEDVYGGRYSQSKLFHERSDDHYLGEMVVSFAQ